MSEREQNNKRFGANHQIAQQSHLHAQLIQQNEQQFSGTQPSKPSLRKVTKVNFGSKFQSLQKLKPIHGGGGGANGGSLISQTNNGMSYLGQMDSSNSSTSNLSWRARANLSPQYPDKMTYNKSGQNLQKCNSSPMNSFINKSNSRPQIINVSTAMFLNQQSSINTMTQVNNVGSHTNIYNSTQPPFRGGDVVHHDMDNTPSSSHHQIVDPRFVYKSNSQKSINWEGTPQNHTHKSINNKNTGSQSHQSLLGSQGKIIQTASSKKMLMPSGSSGTLLRKERKLNFTGKPFAPDSIFVDSIGKNPGDDDEGAEIDQIDIIQVKGGDLKQLNPVKSNKNVQQPKNQAQNYHTASSQQQPSSQPVVTVQVQSQQAKEQVKQPILVPKKIANVRNQSPHDFKKAQGKDQFQNKLITYAPSQSTSNNGRASINAQQLNSQEAVQGKKNVAKGSLKSSTGPTAKKQMANHHPQTFQVALSDLNNISQTLAAVAKQENNNLESTQKIQMNQTQKLKASFVDQNASHNLGSGSSGNNTTQKDESTISSQQNKQKPQTSTQILTHNMIKNNRSPGANGTSANNKVISHYGNNTLQITNVPQGPQYSSKSPAEKMIESSLLQNQTLITNASSAAQVSSRKVTIDQYNLSVQQQQVLTPSRHQIQPSNIRKAGNSKNQHQPPANNKQQQSGSFSKPSERKSLQGSSKAKTSQYELDVQSPSQQHKLSSKSQFKMKGDINNFNDISINDGEHVIKEDEDEFADSTTPFLPSSENPMFPDKKHLFQRVDHSNSNSPSKSNKVPSSLSFKRRSDDQGEGIDGISKRFTIAAPHGEKTKLLVDIDESSMAAVSARGNKNSGNIFTLKDKQELKRNIPKFHNLDFGGQSTITQIKNELKRDSSTKSAGLRRRKMQGNIIIMTTKILSAMTQYFDFENLMKIMSVMKKFREDFTKHPTSFQAQVFKIFKLTLRNLLILGLPSTIQRIQYWNFKTKFFYGKKKKPNLYKTLKRQKADENAAADIRKDVHRTFPDMRYFQLPQKGQPKLFNILNAVAQKNSSTGYIQGMNFLAGTILINLQKGEETFWMMMSILNKYKFDSILDLKNGGLFQILCYQLETFMLAYLPTLANHLKFLKIPTDIYAANWFITMFCYELSLDLVFCILDVFLLEGIKSLIRVSLALLKAMQDDLLKMSYDECMEFLSHCQKDIQLDSQTLLETAFSFKITNSLLLDLELFFRLKENPIQPKLLRAFSKLSLQEEKNKYFWIILPAAPEDIKSLLKNQNTITEEDVESFYQTNIKHRKLREIVEELQTDEDSEIANVNIYAIEKKDIQNAKMLQPSQRKKETLHSKYAQNALQQQLNKRKQFMHFNTDSNNTILELTNDFSKGGHSNGKANQNNSSYYSQLGNQNDLSKGVRMDGIRQQSDVTSNNSTSNKLGTTENQHNLHLSLLMKNSDEVLVTPRKMMKINNELTSKSRKMQDSGQVHKDNESPFIQIGSKIKSIFGNFFKTQEKLNKSYEDQQNDQMTRANFIPLSQFEKQQSPAASYVGALGNSGKAKITKQTRSKSIHQSVLQRESPDIRIATQCYNSNQNVQQKSINIPKNQTTVRESQYQISAKSNIQMKAMHQVNSSLSQSNPMTNQEDSHNVPSNLEPAFGSQSQVAHHSKRTGVSASIEVRRDMPALRIQKQSSKSLERGMRSDGESMVQEEDEECEVDLLSQSADYTIGRVGENVHLKKHQEFEASKRPEILIARDFIASPDEEVQESQMNLSNSRTIDIQNLTINGSKMNMSGSNQLSQTIKINTSTQSSSSQALFNLKKHAAYNSNNPRADFVKEVQINIKTMKSSPPVSPKERYAPAGNVSLPHNSRVTQIRGAQVNVNKKK